MKSLSAITPATLEAIAHGQAEGFTCETLPDTWVARNPNQPPGALEIVIWGDDPVMPRGCERNYAALHSWLRQAEAHYVSHGSEAYFGFMFHGYKPKRALQRARERNRQMSKWQLRPYVAHNLGLLGPLRWQVTGWIDNPPIGFGDTVQACATSTAAAVRWLQRHHGGHVVRATIVAVKARGNYEYVRHWDHPLNLGYQRALGWLPYEEMLNAEQPVKRAVPDPRSSHSPDDFIALERPIVHLRAGERREARRLLFTLSRGTRRHRKALANALLCNRDMPDGGYAKPDAGEYITQFAQEILRRRQAAAAA